MGGNAFNETPDGQQPVDITRLETSVYESIRQHAIEALRPHFHHCISPTDAPEKADHGDVDILVSGPKHEYSVADMASWLGAIRYKDAGKMRHFAVTVPGGEDSHAQIDVHLCRDNVQWLAFMQSYGDLWGILGTSIRGQGLTATDTGLHVRIQELEKRDRKASRIFLSAGPGAVLTFLGLDAVEYQRGFATEQRLFEWLSQSRFINAATFARAPETSDERRRYERPMFARFATWIAANPDSRGSMESEPTRGTTIVKALRFFGKEDIYHSKRQQALHDIAEDEARIKIVTLLVSGGLKQDKANLLVRGLKRWTYMDGQQIRILDHAQMDEASQICLDDLLDKAGHGLQSRYILWIGQHTDDIKALEKGRMKLAKSSKIDE
ncbi:hypothetical protein MBLNU457_g1067t1 [Dothideomycetes sp. NU457]